MPSGSCLCGNAKMSYDGEPQVKALCHCADCHKITGSTFSTNLVVPGDNFKSSGVKAYSKKADSGQTVTSFFCGDCGSTLYRESPSFGTSKVVKVGTLDDSKKFDDAKPAVELYAPERADWVPQVPGTADKNGMS